MTVALWSGSLIARNRELVAQRRPRDNDQGRPVHRLAPGGTAREARADEGRVGLSVLTIVVTAQASASGKEMRAIGIIPARRSAQG